MINWLCSWKVGVKFGRSRQNVWTPWTGRKLREEASPGGESLKRRGQQWGKPERFTGSGFVQEKNGLNPPRGTLGKSLRKPWQRRPLELKNDGVGPRKAQQQSGRRRARKSPGRVPKEERIRSQLSGKLTLIGAKTFLNLWGLP